MNETTLKPESMDIVADNIQKLKEIFPDVFSEDKVDFEKLQEVLGEYLEDKQERYNFTWNGKSKALRLSQTPSIGTLRPCIEESKNWDKTENLYIEGDNLEVLKLLQKTYHSKVKMIYIDPPYNTGNDFVYADDFKDNLQNYLELTGQRDSEGNRISTNSESSGRYHSNWLNMMYPRLRLARNLLKDDGIIFISIDDHEVENLKKLCNEIFGEDNFIACVANVNNPKGRSDDKYVATSHEYLLIYKKFELNLFGWDPDEKIVKRYNKSDKNGIYREIDLRKTGDSDRREDREKMFYYFLFNENTSEFYPTYDEKIPEGFLQIQPTRQDGTDGRWRWGIDTAKDNINKLMPKYMPVRDKWTVFEKDYLDENERIKPTSSWTLKDVNSERGSEQFYELGFGKEVFPRPKPLGLMKRIIEMAFNPSEDNIVLDFFAGSCTIAQAIFEINKKWEGKTKFVLIQLPETCDEKTEACKAGYKNICEIGKERIRRAGEKIKQEIETENQQLKLGEEPKKVPDIGFKVLKLDTSNIKKWNPNADNLQQSLDDMVNNYVSGRTELDVVYEIMLKYGIDLTSPMEELNINDKKIYSIGFGQLVICLDSEITTDIANAIIEHKKQKEVESMVVVFRDNGFKNDSVKTNIKEILKVAEIKDFVTV